MRKEIERYSANERVNHWFTAIAFVVLTSSGLSLFHPSMFWLTNLLGGGTWTRILHPFIGVAMFLSFLVMVRSFWGQNKFTRNDGRWLSRWRDVMNNREEGLPEVGRYNGGQKLLFWVMLLTMILLLVSGIVIWQPYFAPVFPITILRLAVLMHAFSAFVLILGIIVHIYAAMWVKGSIRAMTRGYVSSAWAKKHHAAWYRDVSGS
ncbi:MAG: formate dehydrogenase subunit gamma [Gammaproteobacteria bacterium]|nr:formate dehydrogenase subunit gamma [Gammaproteobacteria bacterium]MDH3371826.1 formate dehydrogenase subunit gamma [Gammaproteobacteria bacterium]